MKHILNYTVLLIATMILFVNCNNPGIKKMPDLRETYDKKDKRPFGTYIAYHQLQEMFYRNTIFSERNKFEDTWKNKEDSGSIYICIAGSLFTTDEDVKEIINFTSKGNDVFFAASEFDKNLLDKLECKLVSNFLPFFLTGKPYQYTAIKTMNAALNDSELYRYFYFPFYRSFTDFDSTSTMVLGVNENNEPDLIVINIGKGRIFLHCEPRAFSNYFLLQNNNYKYLQNVGGYLNPYPNHVYWNDYYARLRSKSGAARGNENNDSSVSEILRHPSLAAAFWLALILLFLFILFGIKRRQRIIDVIKPNENTTVAFTETIGRLYLQKKDNKNIAEKMITYFNEYIRNKYFLNTNLINEDFITALSRKSGVQRNRIDALYRTFNHAHENTVVDDYQLMSLNEQIQNFYKTRN